MKTIDEAAKDYVKGFGGNPELSLSEIIEYAIEDFKAGAEFAQRWIPVDDELPEYTTIDKHNAVNVKFTTINGDVRECTATLELVSQHCFENSPMHNRWFVYPSGGHELKTVTHWRPIELK